MATRTPEPLLSIEELAEWLSKPVGTLYQWRATNRGPRGIKVGGHVRYRRSDVEAWLEDHADDEREAV